MKGYPNWPNKPKSLSERGYRKFMAKQKKVTVNGEEYTLQSVSPTWYFGVNDDCGMTGGGRRDTTKYIDTMLKNVVISPAEVKADGISYFDEKDDIKTPEKLIKKGQAKPEYVGPHLHRRRPVLCRLQGHGPG